MHTRLRNLVLAGALMSLAGCQETASQTDTSSSVAASASTTPSSTPAESTARKGPDMTTDRTMEVALPGGGSGILRYKELKVGDGSIAEAGKVAMVHYTGWLTDGTKFDSSLDRNQPLSFTIGKQPRDVIEAWDRGLRGMRVGGKRRLVVPPELAYGAAGAGRGLIPPNATLVFEVELVGLR